MRESLMVGALLLGFTTFLLWSLYAVGHVFIYGFGNAGALVYPTLVLWGLMAAGFAAAWYLHRRPEREESEDEEEVDLTAGPDELDFENL